MSDPLAPQDLAITLLGTYVRASGSSVWSGGLTSLLEEFGFSHGAARVALTRLARRELISRERSGRLVHYRVTSRLERLLAEGDGRIFSLGDPRDSDQAWTVLWHQIPEDRRLERSRLARRLRFLGFGPVQDSVWVSPHDHREEVGRLLGELGVGEVAAVFCAEPVAADGLLALVERAWDVRGLRERYRSFATAYAPFAKRPALSDRDAFLTRTRLVHTFRGFPLLDPELPDSLLALSDVRARAVEVFHAVFDGLAEPSQRYFDEVTAARTPTPGSGSRSRPPASAGRPRAARR